MIRGFEILGGFDGIKLPTRRTAFSAGYDLERIKKFRSCPRVSRPFFLPMKFC